MLSAIKIILNVTPQKYFSMNPYKGEGQGHRKVVKVTIKRSIKVQLQIRWQRTDPFCKPCLNTEFDQFSSLFHHRKYWTIKHRLGRMWVVQVYHIYFNHEIAKTFLESCSQLVNRVILLLLSSECEKGVKVKTTVHEWTVHDEVTTTCSECETYQSWFVGHEETYVYLRSFCW